MTFAQKDKRMTKFERAKIISRIKYELRKGTHTYTMCECNRNSTRAGECWECEL